MKKLLPLILLATFASSAFAEDKAPEWNPTTLSDATIRNIQTKQHEYKVCVGEQAQKAAPTTETLHKDVNNAINSCENILSQMLDVYKAEGVPEEVAKRHTKQMRTQMTRELLQEMMMQAAAKQPQ